MISTIRTLAAAAALSLGAPLYAQPAIADEATLDTLVDSYVERGIFPMLYVRVEDRDGNVVYEHGVNNPELVPGELSDVIAVGFNNSGDQTLAGEMTRFNRQSNFFCGASIGVKIGL